MTELAQRLNAYAAELQQAGQLDEAEALTVAAANLAETLDAPLAPGAYALFDALATIAAAAQDGMGVITKVLAERLREI